jgi:hypothetical protein
MYLLIQYYMETNMTDTVLTPTFSETYFVEQPQLVNKRLKLTACTISLATAPWPLDEQFKARFAQEFYKAVYEVIVQAKLGAGYVEYIPTSDTVAYKEYAVRTGRSGEVGWFNVNYTEPGRKFSIIVHDKVIQIRSEGCLLERVVFLADKVFRRILDLIQSPPFADALNLLTRVYSVSYIFEHNFRLRKNKIQQDEDVKNFEIVASALALDRVPTGTV